VRTTVTTRRPLAPAVLAALPQPVTERTAADLALTADQTSRVLADEHGLDDPELALGVHEQTAGWPALVQLAGDLLAADPGAVGDGDLPDVLARGTAGWLRAHVLADLAPQHRRLLTTIAPLDPVTASLCLALGEDPVRTEEGLDWFTRTGLVAAARPVPVLAAATEPERAARPRAALRAAARWYVGHGHPLPAARCLSRAGDHGALESLIAAHGGQMLAGGGAAEVVRLIRSMGAEAELALVLGDACRMAGAVADARAAFAPLIADADLRGGWDAGLAWRVAMLHYMCADYHSALAALDRGEPATRPGGADRDTADAAALLACRATVLVQVGRSEEATATAQRALAVADACGEDRSMAAAHLAAAFTDVGERRDGHLAAALAAAERAGDVIQQARVLVNQADRLLREARYPQALAVAERAVRTAQAGGPPGILVTAVHNAGEALTRLGRYDEAIVHFERSMRISRRIGLHRAAASLLGLGDVRRALGHRERSRAAYEEAAALARATAEMQILVPSLAGLAALLADGPSTDTAAARAAADEARLQATAATLPSALIAQGFVARADGDLSAARRHAADAVAAARAGRHADTLADALELAALVATQPNEARAALREAEEIWRRAGAEPGADRMLVLQGRLHGASTEIRAAATAAARRLLALGVETVDGASLHATYGAAAAVWVRVLGPFEVYVGGEPVALAAWRSRQARTLLKILVARNGRPVPRAELCELLWPDDEPQRTGHRLSVLLSAVRQVLDPDRQHSADHYLRADLAGVWLDLTRVTVDVEDLVREAAHGVRLARAGDDALALAVLSDVDVAYRGDAFDDDPYEDWADGVRERARAAWLGALRELVGLHRRADDLDQAATTLVRLLAADPYDESSHRILVEVLVAAGRHGEARRAFERWGQAMRLIDVPAPSRHVLLVRQRLVAQQG
jgi:DNA-binding SARP family transcriptional activator